MFPRISPLHPTRRAATTTTRLALAAALAASVLPAALPAAAQAATGSSRATRVPRHAAAVDRIERTEVRLINRLRRAHHLRPLKIDGTLTRTAGWMALDMGHARRFSHTDSLGRDPFIRLRAFGYPSRDTWRGENLAAGNARPGPTRLQWINSPPHLRNMLDPHYGAIGIARVRVAGSPYRWYWATTFGSRWTRPAPST
ncbi:MAG: CAP domain-containing protein [Thermoleophilia bacterium]|nr:CAP domain-containing protein [Thermoleophilia bacterium]